MGNDRRLFPQGHHFTTTFSFSPKMSPLFISPTQPRFSSFLPTLQCQIYDKPKKDSFEDQSENGQNRSSKVIKMNTTTIEGKATTKELEFLSAKNDEYRGVDEAFVMDLGDTMKREEESSQETFEKHEEGKNENKGQRRGGSSFCGEELIGGEEECEPQNGQLDQTDIYRELILRHLIADISGTCTKLGLPNELAAWSGDDCRRWVAEMCAQFQLNVPSNDAFLNLNGRKMLALGVEEFQAHFPAGGDTLHAQLQLWKTAFESCGQFNNGILPPSQHYGYDQQHRNDGTSPPSSNHQQQEGWIVSHSPAADNFTSAPSSCSSSSQYSTPNVNIPPHFPSTHHQSAHQHYYTSQNALFPDIHQNHQYSGQQQHFHVQSTHPRMPPIQCPPTGPIGLGSDCSATESVSSTQQDDSSSVAEEDFLGQNPANDICQHFFLTAPHQQQQHSMLSANFCQQFPTNNPQLFPHQISASQGGAHISQLNQQPIQQQPHQQRLSSHGTGGTIHLWHFIRELLEQPKEYGGCVRWVDRKEGTFKIESSHHLARYWGIRKNRSAMNYDKLSRSLRQYYKKGIIQKPEKKQRLVYKFLPPYNQ